VFLETIDDLLAKKIEEAGKNNSVDKFKASFQDVVKNMDSKYHFTESKNSEVRFRWYTICIKIDYEAVYSSVIDFLTSQGRMKFIRPLYRDLYRSSNGKELALATFKKHQNIYHSIAQKMVSKDLELNKK